MHRDDRSNGSAADRLNYDEVVRSLFQPLVDLDTGGVVGYEALSRGPSALGLEAPADLFGRARREGRLSELDWACRRAAVAEARRAGFRHPLALFVNAEPEALGGPPGSDAAEWAAMGDLRCFAEITERAITSSPGQLLRLTDLVRSQDWGIALDDVGANPETVAIMPMLQPDVLKLDLRLLRDHSTLEVARLTHAIMTYAGDTGATIVAEGIEDEQQRDLACAFGARLGQGWFFGHPAPLPEALPMPPAPVPLLPRVVDRAVTPSPYATVNDRQVSRHGYRAALEVIWRQVELQAETAQPAPVVLAAFPDSESAASFTGRCGYLATSLPLLAVFGADGAVAQLSGVRTSPLDEGDPTAMEWDLVVIGPSYAVALVARPLGCPDAKNGSGQAGRGHPREEFEFVLTFSRPLVVRAANALLMRLDNRAEAPIG